jgi:type IV pilus assembly protein PilF
MVVLAVALVLGCTPEQTQRKSDSDSSKLAALNVKMAIEYMREGANETAFSRLKKALEYDPHNAPAHTALGSLYERLGETEKAEHHYRTAVRYAPEDSAALNNYGQFLCQHDRGAEALTLFDRALENPLYRQPELAHTNAGNCAYQMGDLPGAEQRLRTALQANPRFAPALQLMSRVAFERNEHLPARAYLQRYFEVGPQTAATLWLGVQVERALGDEDTAASYALGLRSRFPDSNEARALRDLEGK